MGLHVQRSRDLALALRVREGDLVGEVGTDAPLRRTAPRMQRWVRSSTLVERSKASGLQAMGDDMEQARKGWIPEINASEREENLS